MRHQQAVVVGGTTVLVFFVLHLAGYAVTESAMVALDAAPGLMVVPLVVVGALAGRALDKAWSRRVAGLSQEGHR